MLISIITPVLNGEKTILRTLQSVNGQRANYEHIIMDGGSDDDTKAIVLGFSASHPLKWFEERDRSIYEGLWNGLQRARGDVIGTISSDDFYMPWTLAVVQKVFQEHPQSNWLTGIPSWHFEDTGVVVSTPYAPVYFQGLIAKGWYGSHRLGFLQQESMFWRRSLFEQNMSAVAQILKKYRLAADYHLWRHFACRAKLKTVNSILACFSISNRQASGVNMTKYLQECGLPGKRLENPHRWRVINRALSYAFHHRVVKVREINR